MANKTQYAVGFDCAKRECKGTALSEGRFDSKEEATARLTEIRGQDSVQATCSECSRMYFYNPYDSAPFVVPIPPAGEVVKYKP